MASSPVRMPPGNAPDWMGDSEENEQIQRGFHAPPTPTMATSTQPNQLTPAPSSPQAPMSVSMMEEDRQEEEGEEETHGTMDEDIQEMSADDLIANVIQHCHTFGRDIVSNLLPLKVELYRCRQVERELTAENEAINEKLKELFDESALVKDENEKALRKAEKEVQQAKSKEAKLKEQLMEAKNESKEKDEMIGKLEKKVGAWKITEKNFKEELEKKNKLIGSLKQEVSGSGREAVKKLETKVVELETSKKKLNDRLEEKEKSVQMVEGKYLNACKQVVELQKALKDVDAKNKRLKSEIDEYIGKETANRNQIEVLNTRRSSLESTVRKLQGTISKISQELAKEKSENQAKGIELEKKIEVLKEKMKGLRKEKGQILDKFGSALNQFRGTVASTTTRRKRSLLPPPMVSSSEEEDATVTVAPKSPVGVRTDSVRKCRAGNKRIRLAKCPPSDDDDDDDDDDFLWLPPQQINLKSPITRRGNAKPKVSASSDKYDDSSSQ